MANLHIVNFTSIPLLVTGTRGADISGVKVISGSRSSPGVSSAYVDLCEQGKALFLHRRYCDRPRGARRPGASKVEVLWLNNQERDAGGARLCAREHGARLCIRTAAHGVGGHRGDIGSSPAGRRA